MPTGDSPEPSRAVGPRQIVSFALITFCAAATYAVTVPKSMRVKIVLRDKKTGRYYRDTGEWVANPYDALTFSNILEAEEFCRARGLSDLQMIQQAGYFHRPLRYRREYSNAAGDMSQEAA
jgi:hypothetical protein